MKLEYNTNFYPIFKLFSINNNIDPSVDILIESIDRFSFGNDSEDEKHSKKVKEEEKILKTSSNNYGFFKSDNNINENNITISIENILDKKCEEENKSRNKICGIFNKEDFEVNIDKKNNHKNNQLNDSFERKFRNPLKKFLDEEDEDELPDLNLPMQKIEKKYKKEQNLIQNNENLTKIDVGIKKINVNESNDNVKKNNYDKDDFKENEQKLNDIKSELNIINKEKDKEISSNNNFEGNKNLNIIEEKPKKIDKEKNLKIIIDKNEIENNLKINDIDGYESPRLGGKNEDENINNNNDEKMELKLKKIKEENDNSKNVVENKNLDVINLPLSYNVDKKSKFNNDNIIIQRINLDNINNYKSNKKNINQNIPKDNEPKMKEKKEGILNLKELKQNSFIIKNTSNKIKEKEKLENEEKNQKILELTQKLEKSEKNNQMINEKLTEVINMFKNFQFVEQKRPPNSGKNSRRDTPKRQIIKKRCFTPTLSKAHILHNNPQIAYHKRANSFSKIRVNNNNENKLYIDYNGIKQTTYRQLHGKENKRKEKKVNNPIGNNISKNQGYYINRNTIFSTGSHYYNSSKSPYLNNNMNYEYINEYNRNKNYKNIFENMNNMNNMNNSAQFFYVTGLNNKNIDDYYGNIYQQKIGQFPLNDQPQPLFYESNSEMNFLNNNNNHNIYEELIYNKNIINKNPNMINNENNDKYAQDTNYNNSNNINEISLKNNIKNNENNKRKKNKHLDFKDFLPIFDESLSKERNDNISNKNNQKDNFSNINDDYNLMNIKNFKNGSNNVNGDNLEEQKSIEKNEDEEIKKKDLKKNNDNNNIYNNGILNNMNKNKDNKKTQDTKIKMNTKDIKNGKNKFVVDKFNKVENIDKRSNIKLTDEKTLENNYKNNNDYNFPFYLINRNEMFINILSFVSSEKTKKKNNFDFRRK